MNYYVSGPIPNNLKVAVIGCGGTGSFLAEAICRLLTGLNFHLSLIDHDTVERRNTLRQNFFPSELGRNKAEALALRLSKNFSIPISYSTNPLEAPGHGFKGPSPLQRHNLVLTCVDNAKARAAVHKLANGYLNNWVIDAGNDNLFGQILLGNSTDPKALREAFTGSTCIRLPMPGLQVPELLQNPQAPAANRDTDCARAIELREQSPTINQMMATLTADTVLKLLTGSCRYMALYLDLQSSSLRAVPATPEETERVLARNNL